MLRRSGHKTYIYILRNFNQSQKLIQDKTQPPFLHPHTDWKREKKKHVKVGSLTTTESIKVLTTLKMATSFRGVKQEKTGEGQLTILLPPEMVGEVWSWLTLVDLMQYAYTSTVNYQIIQGAITHSLHSLIDGFVPYGGFNRFMAMLRSERAVISGSTDLFFMFCCSYTGVNSSQLNWRPADMDIFELNNRGHLSQVVKYLVASEGFSEVSCTSYQAEDIYYPQAKKVTHLGKDKFRIDIITAYSSSSIAGVFGFHSAPVMNWISGDGFFSAYPVLTSSCRGLVNSMTFTLTNFVPPLPPISVQRCLQKYYERGFDIRRNPACWLGESHICSKVICCPQAMRNVTDHGSMFV
jgi:hypothetical protein